MRLSSTPGNLLDGMLSTPRGLALKVLEADGPRLQPADGLREQDFLLVNGPVFNAPTAKKFLRSLKLLAATTDKAPNAKKLLSGALRALEAVVEKAGGESATLKALGGHPATHPLGETYFTQVPMLLGPIWCACRSRMHRSNGPRTCRPKAVARISVKPQLSWDEASSPAEDDQLVFSPWRGLQAHRPIGSIMRARRHAYGMVSAFCHRFNADMQSPPSRP